MPEEAPIRTPVETPQRTPETERERRADPEEGDLDPYHRSVIAVKVEWGKGSEITPRVIEWLHKCWEAGENGRQLQPDPFYVRNAELTAEVVTRVIAAIEGLFVSELKKYPTYHREAQGVSASEYVVPPGFDKLPPTEQLAVAQGVDRIFQQYRITDSPTAPD